MPLTTAEREELGAGSVFASRYRIVSVLGGGDFAKVCEAVDETNGEHVALKLLDGARHATTEARERFLREAQILRTLRHPAVVRIFDSSVAPSGEPYFTMELLRGATWARRVSTRGKVAPRELLPLLVQIADALDDAHRAGVVHRDLKPDNLFLVHEPDASGVQVKLLDFGLSRLHDASSLTQPGTLIGTPRYMAPEQIMSERTADARVDVYALGVIAYEALSGGHSPFEPQDVAQLLGAILHGRRRSLRTFWLEAPRAADETLARAMATDAKERYSTAGEFVAALHAAFEIAPSDNAPLALVALAPLEPDPAQRPKNEGAKTLLPFEFREVASLERPSSPPAALRDDGQAPTAAASLMSRRVWRWLVPAVGLMIGLAVGVLMWRTLR